MRPPITRSVRADTSSTNARSWGGTIPPLVGSSATLTSTRTRVGPSDRAAISCGQPQRVERVDQAHGGQQVAHLAPLEVADEVEREAPARDGHPSPGGPGGGSPPPASTPAASSAGTSSAGRYLPASTSSTAPGRAAAADGAPRRGAPRVSASTSRRRSASITPPPPRRGPPGGRSPRRRAGRSRSAPARTRCTHRPPDDRPPGDAAPPGAPGARRRPGRPPRRAPRPRAEALGERAAHLGRDRVAARARCPGRSPRPRRAGAPSAATVASSTPGDQPSPAGVRRRHPGDVAPPQDAPAGSRRRARPGPRPGVAGHHPVPLGPVAQVAEEASLAARHLAHPGAVDLAAHGRPARGRCRAPRRARRAVLAHRSSGSSRSGPRLRLGEAARADAAGAGGEDGARRGAPVGTSIRSRPLTPRPPGRARRASASCSSWPLAPCRRARRRAPRRARGRSAGPGGTPAAHQVGAAHARRAVGRPPPGHRRRAVRRGRRSPWRAARARSRRSTSDGAPARGSRPASAAPASASRRDRARPAGQRDRLQGLRGDRGAQAQRPARHGRARAGAPRRARARRSPPAAPARTQGTPRSRSSASAPGAVLVEHPAQLLGHARRTPDRGAGATARAPRPRCRARGRGRAARRSARPRTRRLGSSVKASARTARSRPAARSAAPAVRVDQLAGPRAARGRGPSRSP